MRNLLLSGILFILSLSVSAQPTIHWQKVLGGTDFDIGADIHQTNDGGYILVGFSYSYNGDVSGNYGKCDVWVVRLLPNGSVSWKKNLGGTKIDRATSIQQTTDGGFIIAGISYSNNGDVTGNHGSGDIWVAKLTNTGVISWQKSIGGSSYDGAKSIQQTSDGGYILVGSSLSNDGDFTVNNGSADICIVKLTSTGVISWQKSIGGSGIDYGYSIQQTSDGGYIVAGVTYSTDGDVANNIGNADSWVVALNSNGAIIWEKTFGGTENDSFYSVQQTTDGGYILSGDTESNDGDVSGNHGIYDLWVVKITSSGVLEWEKTLGGSSQEAGGGVLQMSDGGYLVTGSTYSTDGDVTFNNGERDIWLVKLTSIGTISWEKSIGGTSGDYFDFNTVANSPEETSDGGFILIGTTTSVDGDIIPNNGDNDSWVVKFSAIGEEVQLSLYPNPASTALTMKTATENIGSNYTIHDYSGRIVETGVIKKENTVLRIKNLRAGIYVVQILTDDGTRTLRFVKQ